MNLMAFGWLSLGFAAGAALTFLACRAWLAKAVRATEEKYAKIFRSIPDPVSVSTVADGRFIEINDVFVTSFGFTRDEVIGRTALGIGFWSDPGERERVAAEVFEQGGKLRGREALLRTKSREVRWCLLSGEILELDGEPHFLAIINDVTDLKRAEEKLKASEAKFSLAFLAGPDPMIITSLPDGEILDVNDAFCRVIGFSRKAMIGRFTNDVRNWIDLETRVGIVELLEGEGRIRDLDVRLRKRSGEPWLGRLSAERVSWRGRQVVISVLRDVTELKKSQEERERFVAELEAKNAELERFTYTVSHDLKSPLVTIRGFLGFLQQDLEKGDTERARQDLERIRGATSSMHQLLDELLQLSRVGQQQRPAEEIRLIEPVRAALDLVGGRIDEGGVEVDVPDELPVALGDGQRLREVYQNLLENAVKFMGDEPRPRIEIGAYVDGDEVVCYLRDNGVGIEPRYQSRIFGLFERLDTATEGTGVGLALVKRIVETHGGRIWVESVGMGRGTTFWWTLPATKALAVAR